MLLFCYSGLYDPVLDDQEPIYDYALEDLGPQSEPTEVSFKIQQFVDPSDLGSNLLDFGSTPESRSLTASPFVTPTKPYRPFSTEPVVEVPPLEDPIILNPNYRDEFGKTPVDTDPDYLLSAHYQNGLGNQGRYKLPISEQYDPDGKRFVQNVEVVEKLLKYEKHVKSLSKNLEVVDVTKETKVSESVTKDLRESLTSDIKENLKKDVSFSEERRSSKQIKYEEKQEMLRDDVEEKSIKEELQYIEKMRQEIDLEKIEETALSVVEDSIERAVSVAEEIKHEMDEELSSFKVEHTSEKAVSEPEQKDISKSVKSERSKSVEIIDETEKTQAKSTKVTKELNSESEERKMSSDEKYDSELLEKLGKVERKSLISEQYETEEIINQPRRKEFSEHQTFESKSENKAEYKEVTQTVTSDAKSDKKGAEYRAYTIGLQTIPNIRGVVHSSYHYDLLLRTFFLHLTDVMVALSRFVLTQPIFNQLASTQEGTTKTQYETGVKKSEVRKSSQEIFETTKQERKESVKPAPVKETKAVSQKIEKDMKVESIQETKVERNEIVKPVAVKAVKQEAKLEEKVVEKKIVTGAEMAQRSENKLSQELTQKMDAVISEFQTIAVEDVKQEMLQRDRRSRSRSQIEEEVMKESDPLEWLAKVDSRRTSQERTEISKKFSSSETMEKRSKVEESRDEVSHKKSKSPKQTYIAIVESHVYTNHDAIFEDLAEFSETSSVQSAEEINTAIEVVEAISTENVALESAIKELETAKIVEESRELATVTAESAATIQKIEEEMHDSKELIQEEYKKETAIQSTDIQEVLIQETKEIVEPVVEIKEEKVEKVEKVAVNINESLSVAESTEIDIHESKSEFSNVDIKKETVAIVEEERAIEKVVESVAEVIEPKPVEIVEITETVKVKPSKKDETVHDEYAALKIVKTVPVDVQLSPEIIEIEDISELAFISESVVNQTGTGKVGIDESKQMFEKSVSSEITIGKAEAKQASVVNQVSSVQQELELSKKLQAESKISTEIVQESSFTAKSGDRKLSLRTDLESQTSVQSPPSTIDTPTPSTVPPTPLTDEYVFKLKLPLPKSRSATPVPRDSTLTPEDEDPHIVKKKLIPHIETKIERVVYDPPLPTPTADKVQSPVYTKPGLNGGSVMVRPVYVKPGLYGGGVKVRYPVYRKPGLFGGADNPEYSKVCRRKSMNY